MLRSIIVMGLVASVLEAGILTGPVVSSHFAVSSLEQPASVLWFMYIFILGVCMCMMPRAAPSDEGVRRFSFRL